MQNHSIKFILVILAFVSSSLATAKPALPKPADVPGGVVVINLDVNSIAPPKVYYQTKRALVIRDPNQQNKWLTIIGVPLDAKPGTHEIKIINNNSTITKNFEIKSKTYPQQHLKFADTSKALPLAKDLPLIEEQYLETITTYEHWEDKPIHSLALAMPVKGRKSSIFGLQRTVNKKPQSPHSGLDIVAPKGTPVKAAQAGKVIRVGNYFYTGKIVFIDHGQGFITSYCHLDRVNVKSGQVINQGQIIGTIGNTGRATGPHLHWSVSLNGVRVDPECFIYEPNIN